MISACIEHIVQEVNSVTNTTGQESIHRKAGQFACMHGGNTAPSRKERAL